MKAKTKDQVMNPQPMEAGFRVNHKGSRTLEPHCSEQQNSPPPPPPPHPQQQLGPILIGKLSNKIPSIAVILAYIINSGSILIFSKHPDIFNYISGLIVEKS